MQDKFEIEVHDDGVHVWATNWRRGSCLVAEFHNNQDWKEAAQELYELIAFTGHEVKFKEMT